MNLTEATLWKSRADLLRTLAHPVRLALLEELLAGPKCVSDIRDLLEVRQANTSQHLSLLRAVGVVDFHEKGNLRCYYILRPRFVRDILKLLSTDEPPRHRSPESVRQAAQRRHSHSKDVTSTPSTKDTQLP